MLVKSTFLKYALEIGALEFIPEGRELKSGRISPYFFNSGLFTSGEAIHQLIALYKGCYDAHQIQRHLQPDVIYGPAYKGITLCFGLTHAIGSRKIDYAFNRKEAKDHGEGGTIVGANLKGKRVLIVDDVITSGKATRESAKIINAQGGEVVGCLICFDRQEKGQNTDLSGVQQVVEKYGIPVFSSVTFADLFPLAERKGSDFHHMLPAMADYRDHYGV